MRLLQIGANGKVTPTDDLTEPPDSYAILSHTWGVDADEITLEDVRNRSGMEKQGYNKLLFCANQARNDGLKYIWIDTCCIDRTNLVELSEAITSMFRWYQQAETCYVYLSDVSAADLGSDQIQHQWEAAFRESRWFTRGWTLQELLAPASVKFFSRQGVQLGSKQSLETLIHDITSIPIDALRGEALSQFPVEERMKWTDGRATRKVEDRAYCLLGIFDVSMSLRYGEGEKALGRLEHKVRGTPKVTAHSELSAWLAPSQSTNLHAKISSSRHPETGSAFTKGPLLAWLNDELGNVPLWITGKSGTGKTMLFSHIVDVVSESRSGVPAMPSAYHYCAFSDQSSQKLVNLLGSLALQLSTSQPGILTDAAAIFQADQARNREKSLSLPQLEGMLCRHLMKSQSVVFLLDALDESEDFDETVALVLRMKHQLENLKVLITSTRTPPAYAKLSVLEIEMSPNQDIETFVDSQLSTGGALSHLSSDTKARIRSTLLERAEQRYCVGFTSRLLADIPSFRWVSLTLDNLRRQRTGKAVVQALSQIPDGLYSTYRSMLSKIPVADRSIAQRALLWMCFSFRPLSLAEISEAATLEDTDTTADQDSRLHDPTVVLEICRGFIEYDSHSQVVKLAHSSVRNYLLSDDIRHNGDTFFSFDIDQGHRTLMCRCLTYLMFSDFRNGSAYPSHRLSSGVVEMPLYDYVASHWPFHASYATHAEWLLAGKFLSTRRMSHGGNYATWTQYLNPGHIRHVAANTQPLYYAASMGSAPLVHAILSGYLPQESECVAIEQPGGRHGSTALQVACFRGRKSVAKLLVQYGADFWTVDKGSQLSPWYWAQVNGWDDLTAEMIRLRPNITKQPSPGAEGVKFAKATQQIFTTIRQRYNDYRRDS